MGMRSARKTFVTAWLAASLAGAVGAAWPAQAASERSYRGEIIGAPGKIEFVVQRNKHGQRRVKHFHADALVWECSTGFTLEQHFGIRGIDLNRKRFEKEREFLDFRLTFTIQVEGQLRRGGRAAG